MAAPKKLVEQSPADTSTDKPESTTISRDPQVMAKVVEDRNKQQMAVTKIKANIDKSQAALNSHKEHVKELQLLVADQREGPARDELEKVLESAKKHVEDLQEHIAQGERLLAQKGKTLAQPEKQTNQTNQVEIAKAK